MLINFYYQENDLRQTEFLTSRPVKGQDVSEEYVFRGQLFTNCYEPPVDVRATLDDQTNEFVLRTEDCVITSDFPGSIFCFPINEYSLNSAESLRHLLPFDSCYSVYLNSLLK